MVASMSSEDTVDRIVTRVQQEVTAETLDQLDAVASRMVEAEGQVREFLRTIRSRPATMIYVGASKARLGKPDLVPSVRIDSVPCGKVRLLKEFIFRLRYTGR